MLRIARWDQVTPEAAAVADRAITAVRHYIDVVAPGRVVRFALGVNLRGDAHRGKDAPKAERAPPGTTQH